MRSIALVVALASSAALAQQGRGPHMRYFDPNTVATVDGEITSIERITHGEMAGIHLKLKAAEGELVVRLGPAWFVENQEYKLRVGDRVTVTGSRVTVDGKPSITATEVQRGEDVLVLRSKTGFPAWTAWRRAKK